MMWGRINVHWPAAPSQSAPEELPSPGKAVSGGTSPDRDELIQWLREEHGLVNDDSDWRSDGGLPFDIHDN